MKLKTLQDLTREELIRELECRDKLIKVYMEANEVLERLLDIKVS